VNYLRWVREQAGVDGKRDEGTVEAGKEVRPDLPRGLEDVLYAFPMRWTGKRRGNVDLGGGEQVEFTDIATHEYSARETKEREELGEIQLAFYADPSMNSIVRFQNIRFPSCM
jgi:hypothetical protein